MSTVPSSRSLQLYNTLSRGKQVFQPLEPGKVRLYVCGPTVYDDAHLGHARCYITWDVLFRLLTGLGYQVTYARNVTDVDDKILNRAKALGQTPQQVAQANYQSFLQDMEALHVLPPTVEPKATEHIEPMQQGIRALLGKGYAYTTPTGTVYYRTRRFANYGKLSGKPLDDLRSGARVEVDPHKEDPLDFALWKDVPPDDLLTFDFPGVCAHGRPGWHMECSAMNRAIFGDQIDIHAGGADLVFPHHENEIAQSEAWTEAEPFARYWMHNGFVNVSGEKMSKSLGNFSTVKRVLERYDANTIRYFLLSHHYRMPVDFNDEALQGAKNRMVKIERALRQAHELLLRQDHAALSPSALLPPEGQAETPLDALLETLCDDLNTPQALAVFDGYLKDLNIALEQGNRAVTQCCYQQVLAASQWLGLVYPQLLPQESAAKSEPTELTQTVLENIQKRVEAKANKDWATADAIRDELKTKYGVQLLDRKDGTTDWEFVNG
ncbi:MAG: cysteine--tRNA ligase [Candidatus Melainabacteria bacterium]|nr:cysteine--tRNA ligase [Candidatus Melainabacteria bacterium]